MPSPPCITCSYDLASLPEDALCPECATPVRLSIGGDLIDEPPRTIKRVIAATTLLALSIAAGFLEIFLWIASVTPALRALFFSSTMMSLGAYLLHALSAIVATAGCLCLAAPMKLPLPIRRERITRSALNVCACLACIGAVTGVVFAVLLFVWTTDPGARMSAVLASAGWIISACWGLGALTGLLAWALALRLLRGLALRAPDARAARRSARLIAPTLVGLAIVTAVHAASMLSVQINFLGFIAIALAQLVLGVLWLRAILSARRAFTRVRARQRDLENPVLSAPPLAPDQP